VLGQRRFQRGVEEVLDSERFGEIRARCLTGSADGVVVHLARVHEHLVAGPGGDVHVFFVDGEVDIGDAQAGFEQTLVDRAELSHR
jgi:hypothetical protein